MVGSGPAGLAAAQQLARVGHSVTLFEKNDQVGGLLRFGIPDFKLEKVHIDRRVEQLLAEGVEIRTNTLIGDLPADSKVTNWATQSVARAACCRTSTQYYSAAVPNSHVICRCQGASLLACISPWSFCRSKTASMQAW